MANNTPLVSILVCNYNYEGYIEETLNSVLLQDYSNIEIIIVDDGSRDKSVEIIEKFLLDNPTGKFITKYKKDNQGLCYARNDALGLATGEYVLFLDSDDTIPSSYVSKMHVYATREHADVVYGDVNKFGDETGTTDYPEYNSEELLLHNYINISSLLRKSKIGSQQFDLSLNRKTLEDYDFWLGLSLMDLKFVKAKDVYLNYRVQNKSRNENTASVSDRIVSFVEIWEYSITKYRKNFPSKIREDIAFVGLKYQVKLIGSELDSLNTTVQKELVPELRKKSEHIDYQSRIIQELSTAKSQLEKDLAQLRDTRWHRIGHWLAKLPLKIKKKTKR